MKLVVGLAAVASIGACRGGGATDDPGRDDRAGLGQSGAAPASTDGASASTTSGAGAIAAAAGPLTLEEAIEHARADHPQLEEARARAAAARSSRRAAGRWPDPALVATAESLPLGDGDVDPEYLVGIEQPLPISGRTGAEARAADARVAELEHELAARDRAVVARARGAFATARVADAVLAAREAAAADAVRTAELAELRVAQGDLARDELAVARLARWQAESAARAANASAIGARAALQTAIGGVAPLAGRELAGDVDAVVAAPELAELAERLAEAPAMRALDSEAERWRRELDLARAERIPDLDLALLYRRVVESDADALDVGLRLPLPLFRGGADRVAAAEHEVRAAAARRVRAAGELGRAIAAAHAELERALADATLLREQVLPELDAMVARAQARHEAGEASLVDLLIARRTRADREVDRLDALRDAHEAFAQIETLVGR